MKRLNLTSVLIAAATIGAAAILFFSGCNGAPASNNRVHESKEVLTSQAAPPVTPPDTVKIVKKQTAPDTGKVYEGARGGLYKWKISKAGKLYKKYLKH